MAPHDTPAGGGDNAVAWYWPAWAAQADLPTFQVRDTESSHGRYAPETKTILVKDLVKFHGHACDGLFRGVMALSRAVAVLFPDDGVLDRTDLRVLSRNSPCLGDVAAYLTGGRVRFNTQDVRDEPGVWFVVQRITTGETVRVTENPDVYPAHLTAEESRLVAAGTATPTALDALQAAQWDWVRTVLLTTPTETLYTVTAIPNGVWESVPYAHAGRRTDILFRDIPRQA
jgi:formylmethanofuran dehydrogenase subunit E